MHSRLRQQRNYPTQIAVWLLLCCVLIFAIVVVGGVTRLTRSGLSMVEWDPIMGVIPPLSESQWQATFQKYQQFPEYEQVNRGMTLGEFKFIFWMEYVHRLLGRTIGLVFLLPFLYFLFRRRLERSLIPKLITIFLLGGLQGLLGWFMVKSGLIDLPHVSPYRLTAHLVLATVIYGYILWVALGLLFPDAENRDPPARSARRLAHVVTALILVMIASGGFVAGTKAGFTFNTFPLMNGRVIPEGMLAMRPVWTNFFENVATVQFDHRIIAYLLILVAPWFWYRAARAPLHPRARLGSHALLIMLLLQVSLGIVTLLLAVPVALAAAHQAGAILLFTVALFVNHELRRGREPSLEWRTSTSPPWAG